MIGSKTTIDSAGALQRHIDFLQKSPQILAQVVLDVSAEYEGPMVADLGAIPGPVEYPIEWTPAADQSKPPNTRFGYYSAQKAAFFATDGFGKGIPYQRTGKTGMGWRVDISQRGGIVTVAVENTWNAARWVFGNLLGIANDQQQKFHKNTGWQAAAPKLTDWFKRLNDEVYKRYRAAVKEARRK